jgi:hypothetical protein
MRSRFYDCLILKLRKPRSLIAFRAPMPSVAIATQSTNSWSGTAPSRDCRSQQDRGGPVPNALGIATTSPQVQSTSASVRYAAVPTRQRTVGF